MSIGKAVVICENLDSEKYSLEEKALAIREVMNMPTHMSVKKDTLVGMIKWLWNFNLEVSESHSGKRIVEIPVPHGDLIDRSELLNQYKPDPEEEHLMKTENPFAYQLMDKIADKVTESINSVKAIIEAEEEQ